MFGFNQANLQLQVQNSFGSEQYSRECFVQSNWKSALSNPGALLITRSILRLIEILKALVLIFTVNNNVLICVLQRRSYFFVLTWRCSPMNVAWIGFQSTWYSLDHTNILRSYIISLRRLHRSLSGYPRAKSASH
jgi:hypothetical protein